MSYANYAGKRRGMGLITVPELCPDGSVPDPFTGCAAAQTASGGGAGGAAQATIEAACKQMGGTLNASGECIVPEPVVTPGGQVPATLCPEGQHLNEFNVCVPNFTVPIGGCSPGQIQQPDGSCVDSWNVPSGGGGGGGGGGTQPAPVEPTKASVFEKASPFIIAGGLALLGIALVATKKPGYTSNRRRSRRRR